MLRLFIPIDKKTSLLEVYSKTLAFIQYIGELTDRANEYRTVSFTVAEGLFVKGLSRKGNKYLLSVDEQSRVTLTSVSSYDTLNSSNSLYNRDSAKVIYADYTSFKLRDKDIASAQRSIVIKINKLNN